MSDEETLLKVMGGNLKGTEKDYVKKLSHALSQVITKHGVARLRCVGASALNRAEKAFIIARGEAEKNGLDLVSTSSFYHHQI